MKRLILTLGSAVVTLAASTQDALGCASCFGQSDSAQAQGINAGIIALLGFVVLFWVALGSFFVFLARRGRSHGEPLPGDQNDPQHN